jgi:hypothetical protein
VSRKSPAHAGLFLLAARARMTARLILAIMDDRKIINPMPSRLS